MSAPQFQKYPMWMRHPHEQPAVISDDYAEGQNRPRDARPGRPLKFPPVMVEDKDAEDYHAAQGYVAVSGNPTAFIRAVTAPLPPGHVHHEYPRMVDGQIDLGPDAPEPPDNF